MILFSIVDEVPHDEIVIRIAHRRDDRHLVFGALVVFLDLLGIRAPGKAVLQTFRAKVTKIIFGIGKLQRNVERGKMDLIEGIARVAHARDLRRVFDRGRNRGKILSHLFFRLDVEIVRRHPHVIRIAHALSGLHAKKDLVGLAVFFIHVMAVVRGNKRNARLVT